MSSLPRSCSEEDVEIWRPREHGHCLYHSARERTAQNVNRLKPPQLSRHRTVSFFSLFLLVGFCLLQPRTKSACLLSI